MMPNKRLIGKIGLIFIGILFVSAISIGNQSNVPYQVRQPKASVNANPALVNLGNAGEFVALSKAGISATGTTAIVGNIGVSPIDSTAITGFDLIADSTNTFSTSALVVGNIYASDYTEPTPSMLTTTISNMEASYTDVAGRTADASSSVNNADLGGLTVYRGVYAYSDGVIISTDLTISGSATDIVIFQISGTLTVASAVHVILSGGMLAKNIFWQVTDTVSLGTTCIFQGIILAQTDIAMDTGATLIGRVLSQTAITLDANIVSIPAFIDTTTPLPPVLSISFPTPNPENNASLTWTESVGATAYIILRLNGSLITPSNYLLATVLSNTTTGLSYNDTNLAIGTYGYAVRAYNSTGISPISNSVGADVTATTIITLTTTTTPTPSPILTALANWWWLLLLLGIPLILIITYAVQRSKCKTYPNPLDHAACRVGNTYK